MQIKIANTSFSVAGLPTFGVTAAELAAYNVPGLISWVEFDTGLFNAAKTAVTDRKSAIQLPFSGMVQSVLNTKPAVQLTGAQKLSLGNIMPINGDFTRMAVVRPDNASDTLIFGNNDAAKPWGLLYMQGALKFIGVCDGSAGNTIFQTANGLWAVGTTYLVIETYTAATRTHNIYLNDHVTPVKTFVGNGQQQDPALNLGLCAPLGPKGSLQTFGASMFLTRDLSGDAISMAALATYLKTKFGV